MIITIYERDSNAKRHLVGTVDTESAFPFSNDVVEKVVTMLPDFTPGQDDWDTLRVKLSGSRLWAE